MAAADPLLLACLHAPLDAGPRLALSDFLEERGWDAFQLDALRGDGHWEVHRDSSVGWWFDARHVIGRLYPASRKAVICYGTDPVMYKLDLGPVPDGGPGCHACGCRTGIALTPPPGRISGRGRGGPERRWVCEKATCRWPNYGGHALAPGQTHATPMVSFAHADAPPPTYTDADLQIALQFAQDAAEVRAALGLPPVPPEPGSDHE